MKSSPSTSSESRVQAANALQLLGVFGIVKRGDGSNGIGMVESIKIDESNPLAMSKQIATVRVNDSRDALKIPLTKLKDAFTPDAAENGAAWDETKDTGGCGRRRERRMIWAV